MALGFEADIKPLFREKDRDKMMFAFDLWQYPAVRSNADDILAQVEAGDMPCDGAWPPENIEKFKTWRDEGMNP